MSTCKRLNLQTLGSQPVMPKNLSDHCRGDGQSVEIQVFPSPTGYMWSSFGFCSCFDSMYTP